MSFTQDPKYQERKIKKKIRFYFILVIPYRKEIIQNKLNSAFCFLCTLIISENHLCTKKSAIKLLSASTENKVNNTEQEHIYSRLSLKLLGYRKFKKEIVDVLLFLLVNFNKMSSTFSFFKGLSRNFASDIKVLYISDGWCTEFNIYYFILHLL